MTDTTHSPAEIIGKTDLPYILDAYGRIDQHNAKLIIKALTDAGYAIADLSTHAVVPREPTAEQWNAYYEAWRLLPDRTKRRVSMEDMRLIAEGPCRAMINHKDSKPEPDLTDGGRYGSNSGHGHVWERPDGVKVRCGGPGLCAECSRDYARYHKDSATDETQQESR